MRHKANDCVVLVICVLASGSELYSENCEIAAYIDSGTAGARGQLPPHFFKCETSNVACPPTFHAHA